MPSPYTDIVFTDAAKGITAKKLNLLRDDLSTAIGGASVGDMTKAVYDTNNNGKVDTCDSVPWTAVTGVPATFPPGAHQASHVSGTDQIPSATTSVRGLMPQANGNPNAFYGSDGTQKQVSYAMLSGSQPGPVAHAASHVTGADQIPNVSATVHGFAPSPASVAIQGFRTNSVGVPAWSALDFVNVVLFGADPTGATDSTTAIQNAINSLPGYGGIVYFPPGTYTISSPITINKAGRYMGAGMRTTVIQTTSATADIFVLSTNYIEISHLGFSASVTRTGGYYINYVTSPLAEIFVHDFYMGAPWSGIRMGWSGGTVANGVIVGGTTGGTALRIDGVGTGNVVVSNITIQNCDNGIIITQNNGMTFQDVGVYGSKTLAIAIQPVAGALLTALYFNQCAFDTNTVAQSLVVLYSAGANTYIQDTKFTDCWFVSSKQRGITAATASGGVIDGVILNGCTIFHNQMEGVLIGDSGVVNFRLSNSFVCNNGTSGTLDGINLAAGASQFSIIGNRIGAGLNQGGGIGAGNTGYGIRFGGTNTNCIVIGNDQRGNTSGGQVGAPTGTFVNTNNI